MGSLAQPSPSLRPFGASYDSNTRVVSPPAVAESSTSQYAPNDLFGRFGVQGINSTNGQQQAVQTTARPELDERRARQKQLAEAEEAARLKAAEKKAQRQAEAAQKAEREAEEARQRALLLEQEAMNMEMSRQQEEELEREKQRKAANSVNVIVKNLVDGTTPEDVKAAFADFGEIGECKVIASDGDTLTMLVEFSDRNDAATAVQKLEWVILLAFRDTEAEISVQWCPRRWTYPPIVDTREAQATAARHGFEGLANSQSKYQRWRSSKEGEWSRSNWASKSATAKTACTSACPCSCSCRNASRSACSADCAEVISAYDLRRDILTLLSQSNAV